MGVSAGTSGLMGTIFRDARRLQILFCYFLVSIAGQLIQLLMMMFLVCDDAFLAEPDSHEAKLKLTCGQKRFAVTIVTLIGCTCSSLAAHLVGNYCNQLGDQQPLDIGFHEELANLSMMGNDGPSAGFGQATQQPLQPAQPQVQPFAGRPYRVDMLSGGQQAFVGVPQRLP
mmetsp:Transcript_4977/g.11058  ORF Transcript_4977/g.11058 Transcript_4977/m.11058 type:complete len:171 (-) Transcript_4977:69-581(-)